MTMTMFTCTNLSQARHRRHELQSKYKSGATTQNSVGFGSSQPSSNCSPSEKGHDKTMHPYLLLHLSSTNSSGKENPKQQTPPENSPHGGYTVDELFRLIWQPGWKNYFNWLQAQNAALQLRAWSTVPKTVKNHFSCSWLDRLPNKNTYPRRHWIFTFSGTASVAQTVQQQRKSVVYGTKLHSTSTHSESRSSKNLNVLSFKPMTQQ